MAISALISINDYVTRDWNYSHLISYEFRVVVNIQIWQDPNVINDELAEMYEDNYLLKFDHGPDRVVSGDEELTILSEVADHDIDSESNQQRVISSAYFWLKRGDIERAMRFIEESGYRDKDYEFFLEKAYPIL